MRPGCICLMQIASTVRRHIYEHMPRNTAHSDHTSCMLDRIIRINELCSDTAHFRTLTHSKHFFQPVRIDGFYIIIQEKQIFSLCMRRSKVIDGRIIKFFSPSQKMDLPVSGKLFIISENLISSTVILHDYDFKRRTVSAALRLEKQPGETWQTDADFGLSVLAPDGWQPLELSGLAWQGDCLTVPLCPGVYRILTSSRLPSGDLRMSRLELRLDAGQMAPVRLQRQPVAFSELAVDFTLADFQAEAPDGRRASAAELTI